jgi:sodium/hydrogen antiporter
MQTELLLTLVAAFLLVFALISRRVRHWRLTAPMLFVVFGILLGESVFGVIERDIEYERLNLLAEVTLVLVLFTDASRIKLKTLRRDHNIPIRMLVVGLPLGILSGTLAGLLIFSELTVLQAAVLAIILTPTDAALAQTVMTSERVPMRIRQALNVESGLNDGLALPILLIVLSLVDASGDAQMAVDLAQLVALQLILGPLIGFAVGYGGGKAIVYAAKREWMSEAYERLSALGVAFLAYALVQLMGGNGFVAAFIAGMTLGNTAPHITAMLREYSEATSDLLILLTFLLYGAVMVPDGFTLDGRTLFYMVLSLTVVRMIPTVISLVGTRLRWDTALFLGWFGPRGIASIIYVLLMMQEQIDADAQIFDVAVTVVLFSVFLHGFSAEPATRLYSRRLRVARDSDEEETPAEELDVQEIPLR